jgi:hypothetical protein
VVSGLKMAGLYEIPLANLSALKPNRFYAKIKIDFKDKTTDVSFKTSIKIFRCLLVSISLKK